MAVTALSLLVLLLVACARTGVSESDSRKIAEDFVKKEATFAFDGMPETLKLVSSRSLVNGCEFTYEYDSRHGGYGDRTGQIVTQVITPHQVVVTVAQGITIKGEIDSSWDMINQKALGG